MDLSVACFMCGHLTAPRIVMSACCRGPIVPECRWAAWCRHPPYARSHVACSYIGGQVLLKLEVRGSAEVQTALYNQVETLQHPTSAVFVKQVELGQAHGDESFACSWRNRDSMVSDRMQLVLQISRYLVQVFELLNSLRVVYEVDATMDSAMLAMLATLSQSYPVLDDGSRGRRVFRSCNRLVAQFVDQMHGECLNDNGE